jgi:chemotaxis protein methyltransferase CheR
MTVFTPVRFGDQHEYPYTHDDFEAIAAMVHAHSGICMTESKAMLIYSRLTKLLRERGIADFAQYVDLIRTDTSERARAIEALTTNHTKFFREIHHFDHFEEHVRPVLANRLIAGGRVRLWSSAASSGEEPYSLAMTMLGADKNKARQIAEGDIALLGTDLAGHVLRIAAEGVYPAAAADDIPDRYASIWTRLDGASMTIAKSLKNMIRFRKLNLLNSWPIKGQFDVIFCRNVMIYFDEPTKELLLRRLSDQLVPGGYLYIGHSERLIGSAATSFTSIGQTIYRKDKA